jgi:hypothetical protein
MFLNCQTREGESPLTIALKALDKKMVNQLVKAKDINLGITINEKTPLQYLLEQAENSQEAADIFIILFAKEGIDKTFTEPLLNLLLGIIQVSKSGYLMYLFTNLVKYQDLEINRNSDKGKPLVVNILGLLSINNNKIPLSDLLKQMFESLFTERTDLNVNVHLTEGISLLTMALQIPNYEKGVQLILPKSSQTIINQAIQLNRRSQEYEGLLLSKLDS